MSPAQALKAGTANGAELLGIADQTGTLQPGKDADIVAVAGKRATDIEPRTNGQPLTTYQEK
jgi:imidazolonepropionase-like amidohydrolase